MRIRMDVHPFLTIENRQQFRRWLEQHHVDETCCWISMKRGKPKDDDAFYYLDAVEEALCFGWIDSTTKKLPNGTTVQRFSPRRHNSVWSELNKARVRRLERLEYMTDAGRAVLPDMDPNKFIIDPIILRELQSDAVVWKNFQTFPPLYQRVRIDTLQRRKKYDAIFHNGLKKLIENTRNGLMYGDWNDDGRLSEA
ncbi:MAG: YdeI/OmpD-associated family protein [Opitutales bacterium]|nr:YdeI/OmpD-associated family protein [Opitutales bacterium]